VGFFAATEGFGSGEEGGLSRLSRVFCGERSLPVAGRRGKAFIVGFSDARPSKKLEREVVARTRNICGVVEWGVVPYAQACAWQAELVARRKAGEIPDLLVLCQHPPVITLGRNARRENLLLPEEELARRGVEVHASNRGGDVTFHGPGQLVGYPIIDLSDWRKDVVAYVRALEEVLIRTASTVGVEAERKAAPRQKRQLYTGVWVGEEKLAAIGVHISRWITSHGFALNVTTDVSYFDLIVPCGIADKSVTSLERLREPSGGGPSTPLRTGRWAGQKGTELMDQAEAAVVESFGEVFGRTMKIVEPDQWEAWLGAQPAAAS
jgi:lipoyl(octanoyl) transferase